jgi:hypothetical protein
MNNRSPGKNSEADKLFPLRDPPETKWIGTTKQFELAHADGPVRKEINPNADDQIRLSK